MMRQFLISIFLFLYLSTSYANGLVPNDTIWKKKKNGERFYVIYNGEVDPPPLRKAVPCFEIGLNTFTGDVPDAYTLRTISARYVGVGFHERFRVGGEESWWAIQIGIEGTWNNFRFDADEYLVATDEGNAFVENGFELSRNKLTSVQIGVPLMAHYQFRKDNESTWQVGLGGYASYVVSSYSKIRFEDEEGITRKNKSFSDFELNPFRVGLQALVGYKQVNLFVKYDVTPLFEEGNVPDIQVLTFGIRLQP